MAENIKTKYIGKDIVEAEYVVLSDTPTLRLAFKAQIHDGGVRGEIIRFKRDNKGKAHKCGKTDFRRLNLHEGAYIELKTEALEKLYENITKCKAIKEKGLNSGSQNLIIAKDSEELLVINEKNKAKAIKQFLEKDYSLDFWKMLEDQEPAIATKLSLGHIQNKRKQALEIFNDMIPIKGTGEEDYWQSFFENNEWIFGYGLSYQFLHQEQKQPRYGNLRVDGTGTQKGDILLSTEGLNRFTVLVELKTPATPLLKGSKSQRNGAWSLSNHLTDAITQIQANCATWEISGSRTDDNKDRLENNNTFTIAPRGIIVIGSLTEITESDVSERRDKRNTFERFRRSLTGIEIITYDELYEKAKFIINNNE